MNALEQWEGKSLEGDNKESPEKPALDLVTGSYLLFGVVVSYFLFPHVWAGVTDTSVENMAYIRHAFGSIQGFLFIYPALHLLAGRVVLFVLGVVSRPVRWFLRRRRLPTINLSTFSITWIEARLPTMERADKALFLGWWLFLPVVILFVVAIAGVIILLCVVLGVLFLLPYKLLGEPETAKAFLWIMGVTAFLLGYIIWEISGRADALQAFGMGFLISPPYFFVGWYVTKYTYLLSRLAVWKLHGEWDVFRGASRTGVAWAIALWPFHVWVFGGLALYVVVFWLVNKLV